MVSSHLACKEMFKQAGHIFQVLTGLASHIPIDYYEKTAQAYTSKYIMAKTLT